MILNMIGFKRVKAWWPSEKKPKLLNYSVAIVHNKVFFAWVFATKGPITRCCIFFTLFSSYCFSL